MCGIVGLLTTATSPERLPGPLRTLDRMARALQHRGPNGAGALFDLGPGLSAFLGHRRLAIFDPSPTGHQPMTDASGRFTVSYNGAIYNHVELAAELSLSPAARRSHTDTEVLLHAWAAWGPACLGRLNGMFAAALWDKREQALYLFRDRFGVKPLYYALGQRDGAPVLALGSEIKAVLAAGLCDAAPDLSLLAAFLQSRDVDHEPERTAFAGVRAVPPGCYVRVDAAALAAAAAAGRLSPVRYFALTPPADGQRRVDAALAEELRALVQDSVALRLRADVPIGGTLSGGLDSSLITALVAGPLAPAAPDYRIFTCQFPDSREPGDESAWADAVLTGAGIPAARVVRVTLPPAEFLRDLDTVLFHQEEPFADPSICAHFALMRAVAAAGVRVVLTGQGGDEVFGGYGSYVHVLHGALLRAALAGGPGARAELLGELTARQALTGEPAARLGLGAAYHALPGALREAARRLRLRADYPLSAAARSLLAAAAPRFGGALPGLCGGDPRAWAELPFDVYLLDCMARWALPHVLRHDDRSAMAHGIESRAPLLDYRLAELMVTTHPTARIGGGQTKRLLREAARGLLPEPVRLRADKRGFFAPQRELLWASEAAVRAACAELPGPLAALTDRRGLDAALTRFYERRDGGAAGVVWAALVTSRWLSQTVPRLAALAVD